MVFERIVVGVDGSEGSVEVARQASRLIAPDGRLILLEIVSPGEAVTATVEEIDEEARIELEQVRAEIGTGETRVVEGAYIPGMLAQLRAEEATLVALGVHRHRRIAGILLADVTTRMLHDAPCSVLVSRPADELDRFPRSIVVGLDGAPPSLEALLAARELAGRTGASLTALAALDGRHADREALEQAAEDVPLVVVDEGPVDGLVAADADLLVLGSRGLHGLKSLGSVSERVAHRASCSVLVVRERQAR